MPKIVSKCLPCEISAPVTTPLQVDKYEWIDLGSSFVPSELVGCFLYPQLHEAEEINSRRQRVSVAYHHLLQPLEALGALQLMTLDDGTGENRTIFELA